eukprot:1159406-Pelagomonas_calceolata.AAC.10
MQTEQKVQLSNKTARENPAVPVTHQTKQDEVDEESHGVVFKNGGRVASELLQREQCGRRKLSLAFVMLNQFKQCFVMQWAARWAVESNVMSCPKAKINVFSYRVRIAVGCAKGQGVADGRGVGMVVVEYNGDDDEGQAQRPDETGMHLKVARLHQRTCSIPSSHPSQLAKITTGNSRQKEHQCA